MSNYNVNVCNAIIEQLGGRGFRLMTGAKNFSYSVDELKNVSLYFKIGKNSAGINHVKVTYNYGRDDYSIVFSYVTIKGITEKKSFNGVYCDQLKELFEDSTGMVLTMPKFN